MFKSLQHSEKEKIYEMLWMRDANSSLESLDKEYLIYKDMSNSN